MPQGNPKRREAGASARLVAPRREQREKIRRAQCEKSSDNSVERYTGGLAQSLHGRVGGLPAQQAPHHLNEQVTHHRVAAAVDAAFAPTAIALVDARAQPGVAGDLAAVVKALESPGFPTGG